MRLAVTLSILLVLTIVRSGSVRAQSVREHTRPKPNRSTAITELQATELTLTLTEAAVRPIQVWLRTSGFAASDGKTLKAVLSGSTAALVKAGQRVRAFPPESRSSMYQARITRVAPQTDGIEVTIVLSGQGRQNAPRYIIEIVTEPLEFLSVPNEAIIETGGKRLVYVHQQEGQYEPREIQAGMQGELFTQVLGGLKPGEQVVTFGSFFIDANHKLKGGS